MKRLDTLLARFHNPMPPLLNQDGLRELCGLLIDELELSRKTDRELRDAIAEAEADIKSYEVDSEGAKRAAVTIGKCLDELERRREANHGTK